MARFGLVGGTYQAEGVNADCQRCMNWYAEADESVQGASPGALFPTPGLKTFAAPPKPPIQSATLTIVTSHVPDPTNAMLCDASVYNAIAQSPSYTQENGFMSDSTAWTLRTTTITWNPSTNTWGGNLWGNPIWPDHVYSDITTTVVSFWAWYSCIIGCPVITDTYLIYDCYIDITYVGGAHARLRPTSVSFIPNGDGPPVTGTITNPSNAADYDPTSYALITRTRHGYDTNPTLQLTSFA